jgi:hypothetical protein
MFPGSAACFDSVSQATDARLLAQAMQWASTTPACANEAFNIVNGDLFRWKHLWPAVADYFGMEAGPVRPLSLASRRQKLESAWNELAAAHELKSIPFADLGNWSYFDFTLRFDDDDISLTNKARRFGFDRFVDTDIELFGLFDRLRAMRIIP